MQNDCFKNLKLLGIVLLCIGMTGAAGPKMGGKEGARIFFNSDHFNLGQASQGTTPSYTLKFFNRGDEDLEIEEIKSSCGCTAVIPSSTVIKPGESAKLSITIDTTGKSGDVPKTVTIYSNDPLVPEKILHLSLNVIPSAHPDFDVGKSLFSGKCASCHFTPAKGLSGYPLYLAVCAMCHGQKGEGGSARKISSPAYLQGKSNEYFQKWIAFGKKGTAMPGYAESRGGPLNKAQIDSLIEVIMDWDKPNT